MKERLSVTEDRYEKHHFFPALLVWNSKITAESQQDCVYHKYVTIGEATNEYMYRFSPEAREAFEAYLKRRMHMPRFANARSVRNAIDRVRLRQANRLFAKGGKISKTDLMTIEAEDILASRVFSEEMSDDEPQRDSTTEDQPS